MAGKLERLLAEISSIYLDRREAALPVDVARIPYSGLVGAPAVGPDDEETVAAVTRMLRTVAAAAERDSTLPPPPPSAVYGVLGSSELIMRWECLAGRSGEVPGLLHGFTYLATVFFLDRPEALRKSEEVRALVEAAGFEPR